MYPAEKSADALWFRHQYRIRFGKSCGFGAMGEIAFRFLVGGLAVSAFATLGDVLKPKSFAGLFGAAPSVAIATLALAVSVRGPEYAAVESSAMVAGAVAFLVYAGAVACIIRRFHVSVLVTAILLLPVWFATAFGLSTIYNATKRL
jgi:hypothetical protein